MVASSGLYFHMFLSFYEVIEQGVYLSDMMQPSIRVALTKWSHTEPERGFKPGSSGYKATALPFELSSIDHNLLLCQTKNRKNWLVETKWNPLKLFIVETWKQKTFLGNLIGAIFYQKRNIFTLEQARLAQLLARHLFSNVELSGCVQIWNK